MNGAIVTIVLATGLAGAQSIGDRKPAFDIPAGDFVFEAKVWLRVNGPDGDHCCQGTPSEFEMARSFTSYVLGAVAMGSQLRYCLPAGFSIYDTVAVATPYMEQRPVRSGDGASVLLTEALSAKYPCVGD